MNLWQTYLHKISIDRINIKVTKKTASFTKDFAGCIINVSEVCIFPIRKNTWFSMLCILYMVVPICVLVCCIYFI